MMAEVQGALTMDVKDDEGNVLTTLRFRAQQASALRTVFANAKQRWPQLSYGEILYRAVMEAAKSHGVSTE